MMPRTWEGEDFRAAYERYRTFYRWAQQLRGNIVDQTMVNQYTDKQNEREEITVMHLATCLMNEYGVLPAQVFGVDVNEDGRVALKLSPPKTDDAPATD